MLSPPSPSWGQQGCRGSEELAAVKSAKKSAFNEQKYFISLSIYQSLIVRFGEPRCAAKPHPLDLP